ncbi:MAG TPA: SDR family oxidoreductase [Acidimicrobiales bacterium]|nr:SDR family oxidoreductase [Acidimicrobiales bacterium]
MTTLTGRTALITGGASGIGLLLGKELVRRGAGVVLWDIDESKLQRATAELGALSGRRCSGYLCDVGDAPAVRKAADEVLADGSEVDIVVNNAGIVTGAPLLELPDESIEATFRVNVLSLYWVTKAFLPGMMERRRGHVVTIASAAGLVGVARQTDYSASKHAAVGFDESLRMELARLAPALKTTVVCPFYVDTGMFAGVRTRFPRLLPILRPEAVARRIATAVEKDRRRLIMPAIVRLVPTLRSLPPPVFDKVMDAFGVNVSMDEFVGHAGPRP